MPNRLDTSAMSESKPTVTGSMQKRATAPHLTRRLSILPFRAMRSSDWSVSTPSDVATSRACSSAVCEEPRTLDILEEQRGTALTLSALLSESSCSCPPPVSLSGASSSTSMLSSMAAASSRSAAMRSRSSLSRAPMAEGFTNTSEVPEVSCARPRSRSSAARARTSSSGSSTSPPSASRAATAASEPHHEACAATHWSSSSSAAESPSEAEATEAGEAKAATAKGEAAAEEVSMVSTSLDKSSSCGGGELKLGGCGTTDDGAAGPVPPPSPTPPPPLPPLPPELLGCDSFDLTTSAATASLTQSALCNRKRCPADLASKPLMTSAMSCST
mmetsp:Transcript_32278/g.85318  ORF Transcript_32278/g.85318 Transcript_32278/m.85318 type:complete len:331 (-) Transcript_32278:931-1923(-)